jgi:hypothetical protein
MRLLPIAYLLGVLGIAEIVLVFGFGQPSSLQLPLPGFATVWFKAKALALCAATVGKKQFGAVEALGSGALRLHRFQNQKEPVAPNREKQRKKIQMEEDSA